MIENAPTFFSSKLRNTNKSYEVIIDGDSNAELDSEPSKVHKYIKSLFC